MAINNFNVGVGTTSQLTRYRYVATGGETSVSGSDADGKTLSYTVGLEQVFLNGVNLVRGQDYTATNGTSVGSLTALVASDVVEVFAFVPFNIANALTVSTVDAKGDLLVGTGADAVGRLAVGTDGQLLSAASGETSGLKWANGGLTLIKTDSFSAVSSVNVDSVFSATYDNYRVLCNITNASADCVIYLKLRAGTDSSAGYYTGAGFGNTANAQGGTAQSNSGNGWQMSEADTATASNHLSGFSIDIKLPFASLYTVQSYFGNSVTGAGAIYTNYGGGVHGVAASYNGFTVVASSGNITGTYSVYGYNK
jgi:hypothetical protein